MGLKMMHRRNGSYFLKKERSQIMDGACGRNCYFFFNCGYGSRRYLVSVWLVCIKKMWVYGAAGFGIAILGTVLLHMMRGKGKGLLPGKYGGTGAKEPENSWQVFYEETEEAQNAEKAEEIRQGSAPEKYRDMYLQEKRQQKDSRKNN